MSDKTIHNIEGFLDWAARNELTISFSRRANFRESHHLAMRVTSSIREYQLERTIPHYELENNSFTEVLLGVIISFEKEVFRMSNRRPT